jgi:hypothetical protein
MIEKAALFSYFQVEPINTGLLANGQRWSINIP